MPSNKNILIIGASSGIGAALTTQLLNLDYNVFAVSRRTDIQKNHKLTHLAFDITSNDFSEFESFLPEELHGLVYCPGTITLRPFNRLTEEDFLFDYRVNVLGAVKSIQAAIPALKKGKPSSVVLFSTVAVKVGLSFHASIASAKAAVEGLAKSLAVEYASSQIRFNVIAPSITDTPLAANILSSEQKIEASANRHPIKKIGTAEDMAHMVRVLLGAESAWITGQVINIDGGLSTLKSF